jgi:hypothetical protein
VVAETSRAMDEAVSSGWRRRSGREHESQLFIDYLQYTPVLSGFLVLKFKSNLGMQICSILAKIAHNAVAVSRQIGCVQSQRQLFDDVRIGILSNYFDVGFQPGTQWEKGVLRSDVSSLPKSKIAIDAETGSNPLRRGLAQVN